MRILCNLLGVILSLGIVLPLSAQSRSLRFHKKPDYYLQVQSEECFKVVDEGLDAYPPVVGSTIERRLALYNLDYLLHDTTNDNSVAFCNFVASRLNKLIADLKRPMKRDMRIYKIYNDAFIVRTKSVNIAFDISRCRCRGFNEPIITKELAEKLVEHCDVLFLSHNHGDHVDRFVVDLFIKAGKPVIAAPNILVDVEGVTHRRIEDCPDIMDVKLKGGEKLHVTIFPGYQSTLMNNVYVVTTPEKYTVCHTGDLYGKRNVDWMSQFKDLDLTIDALLVNCWTNNIDKTIATINPRYVISAHENEMGHTIDHREAFWLTFTKLAEIKHPYVIMAWGEWFSIK